MKRKLKSILGDVLNLLSSQIKGISFIFDVNNVLLNIEEKDFRVKAVHINKGIKRRSIQRTC